MRHAVATAGIDLSEEDEVVATSPRPHHHLHHHIDVEVWDAVHRAYYVDRLSIRAIARASHVSKRTVKEILFPWPGATGHSI